MPRQKGNRIIPGAPLARLLQKAGASRASAGAVDALVKILEEKALEVGKIAVELSKHAGRRTLNEDDVRLAIRKLQK